MWLWNPKDKGSWRHNWDAFVCNFPQFLFLYRRKRGMLSPHGLPLPLTRQGWNSTKVPCRCGSPKGCTTAIVLVEPAAGAVVSPGPQGDTALLPHWSMVGHGHFFCSGMGPRTEGSFSSTFFFPVSLVTSRLCLGVKETGCFFSYGAVITSNSGLDKFSSCFCILSAGF